MLLVRISLGPSPIHGLGVFAAEPIAKGTEVWRFTLVHEPSSDRHGVDRAARDIAIGEELTVNYGEFERAPVGVA